IRDYKVTGVQTCALPISPGAFPFNPNFSVDQYVSLAGGPNRFARSLSDVRVIDSGGNVQAYAPGLRINPGDTMVVPERDFSRSRSEERRVGKECSSRGAC